MEVCPTDYASRPMPLCCGAARRFVVIEGGMEWRIGV